MSGDVRFNDDVTHILRAVSEGQNAATEALFGLLYNELRRMAQKRMSQESSGQTLQATALVNEAFIRLVGNSNAKWENRQHFISAAAEAMRRILVDAARRKRSEKRGGNRKKFPLKEGDKLGFPVADEIVDLHEALKGLEKVSPEKAELIKLRFFAGFSNSDAAEILGISVSTAERYWTYSKAWLKTAMTRSVDVNPVENSESP